MSDWNFTNLDLSSVEEGSGSTRLQQGVYTVECKSASIEPVGATNNRKLVLDFDDVDGQGDIRVNLNIKHTSGQAQEIALRQLKSFLVCAGHSTPDKPGDVATLKGLKCKIRVGLGKPWTGDDGAQRQTSEVKSYMPIKGDDKSGGSDSPTDTKDLDDEIPF